ncbi:MAG: family efflux transporter [Sphingomonas bacterium]|nr:family efflux transporter [Sphingomonas bacterium]
MRLNAQETAAEARRILRLAWPVMLTSLNWTLMHLIDVAVVGHAGTGELGALAAGRTLTFITIVMGLAGMSGILVFTARADGAGDLRGTGDYLRRGLLFALLIGTPTMLLLLAGAETMIRAAGIAPEFVAGGTAVVRAMALSYPFQFVLTAASFFLEGVSRPRRVAVVNLAMLPLNALLAWAWVGGHFGLPAQGAVGAVLATAAISALGAAAMLAAAWTLPDAGPRGVRDLSRTSWAGAVRGLPALLAFGWVPAVAAGLELAGFSYLIVLSTQLGAVTAAAFQTVFSLHNFAFAMALGFGSAAGVRAGNAVGAGAPHAAIARSLIAAVLAMLAMVAVGIVYVVAAQPLMLPFSADPEVIGLGAAMLATLAPFMFFDGVQVVFAYALRSLGDQVAAGIVGVIAFFGVTGGLGWLLVRGGVGPLGLVYASAAGMASAALLQGGRVAMINSRLRSQS